MGLQLFFQKSFVCIITESSEASHYADCLYLAPRGGGRGLSRGWLVRNSSTKW